MSRRLSHAKVLAVGAAIVAYIGVSVVGTAYGSAALYQLAHKQRPRNLTPFATQAYWRQTAADPVERKKLWLAIALPATVLFFVLPMAVAGLGPKRRELHGSARFANRMEIHQAQLRNDRGIVLGKYEDRFLTLPGQQSVLLSAPTRSGKGVGVVVPNLLTWPDSVCVVDIKGENFELTAGFRASHGQKVYAWAPFAEDGRTHRHNPLSYVRTASRHVVGDILAVAQIIYPSDPKGTGTESFFNDQARNLFLGLGLYLVETPEAPRTIGELLRHASGRGRPTKDHIQDLITSRQRASRPLSDPCADALMRFLSTSENTLSSILATLNAPLTVFVDTLVDAATSTNDFSLQDLRRQRMSVYVCIPPNRLADASVLLNLFFAQLVNLNTAELPERNPALKYQCLLVLDEFTAMGRVSVFAKGIGYLAGYNLRCLTIVQSVSQLDAVYGDKEARTFVTNHAAQVLYAPREQRDANEYSEMLGTFTEKAKSKGRSVNHGTRGGGSSQSTNVSDQRRALLLPQEFKELGTDREVILIENVKPILADKIRYYSDAVYMPRLVAPPPLPVVDLELYRARIEQRTRSAFDGELFSIDQVAADYSSLPDLTAEADEAQVDSFVAAFLETLSIEDRVSAEEVTL